VSLCAESTRASLTKLRRPQGGRTNGYARKPNFVRWFRRVIFLIHCHLQCLSIALYISCMLPLYCPNIAHMLFHILPYVLVLIYLCVFKCICIYLYVFVHISTFMSISIWKDHIPCIPPLIRFN
jgi:hypothetical protein